MRDMFLFLAGGVVVLRVTAFNRVAALEVSEDWYASCQWKINGMVFLTPFFFNHD